MTAPIAHAAKLRIESERGIFDFLLAGGAAGDTPLAIHSYAASYSETMPFQYSEIPLDEAQGQAYLLWDNGKSGTVSLTLKLVVGASIDIDTPDDLIKMTEELARMAYGRGETGGGIGAGIGGQQAPWVIRLYIGTWFFRYAIVKSVNVSFGRPWDPETGKPYVAQVQMELQYVFSKVPSNTSFKFEEG